jgi:hypothetical protein
LPQNSRAKGKIKTKKTGQRQGKDKRTTRQIRTQRRRQTKTRQRKDKYKAKKERPVKFKGGILGGMGTHSGHCARSKDSPNVHQWRVQSIIGGEHTIGHALHICMKLRDKSRQKMPSSVLDGIEQHIMQRTCSSSDCKYPSPIHTMSMRFDGDPESRSW